MPLSRLFFRWLVVGFSLFLLGCTKPLDPVPRNPERFLVPPPQTALAYRLQPGDEVDVRLTYNPEFSERVTVAPDGTIQLALIGTVEAAGRTAAEMTTVLTQRYAQELRHPDLTVITRSFASNIIFVGGEVARGGTIPLIPGMTVIHALLAAGGPLDSAAIDKLLLLRPGPEGSAALRVYNLRDVLEGRTALDEILLDRLDVVFVPRSNIAEMNLWVEQYVNRLLPFNRSLNLSFSKELGAAVGQ